MSRIANSPINVPQGVEVSIDGGLVRAKGSKGELAHKIHALVDVSKDDGVIKFAPNEKSQFAEAMAGTTRALVKNMVMGVSKGFEKKLEIVGVGYRAQVQGKVLNLTLGFSHPVHYKIPDGITIETPSQTEIIVKGTDKQQVGQVAADLRAYRPPEPYKGKGVKYADEHIIRKEAKKA